MAFLLAVLAGERIESRLGTVTSTVAVLLTIHALDGRSGRFDFNLLFLAVLESY